MENSPVREWHDCRPRPLAELVLTFHQARLARIVATYDREKTVGLTDADLEELLSEVYGVPLLRSTAHARSSPPIAQHCATLSACGRTPTHDDAVA